MMKIKQLVLGAILSTLIATPTLASVITSLDFEVEKQDVTWEGIDNESSNSDFNIGNIPNNSAFAINDASTQNNSDAFDDALSVAVNGLSLQNSTNDVLVEELSGGTHVIADSVFPFGFDGEQSLFFFNSDPIARLFVSFTNFGLANETAQVEIATDLGSDGDETLIFESQDNRLFDKDDSAVVFSDNRELDPNILFTFFGEGAPLMPTTSGLFDGDDVNTLFDIELAPRETKSLLLFVGVYDNVNYEQDTIFEMADLLTGDLNTLRNEGFLEGLSESQINSVVNYQTVNVSAPTGLLFLFGLALMGTVTRKYRAS
jgi:hypothetical protein